MDSTKALPSASYRARLGLTASVQEGKSITAGGVGEIPFPISNKPAPSSADAVAGLLKTIAQDVPYYLDPPATRVEVGGRTEPRVDLAVLEGRAKAPSTTIAGSVPRATLERAFSTWVDTPRRELWARPFGKALAHFALHRYGLADVLKETRNKIIHAAEVTWSARVIFEDQARRFERLGLGPLLAPEWLDRLEYAGIVHDVGYASGGFMHPAKGARDLLANFTSYADNQGLLPAASVDALELEKVVILAQMHGMCFPWDRVSDLLPGDHYVSVDLALALVREKNGFDELRRTLRAEYPCANLAWLDDDRQMEQLVKAGWILHSGDKFLGQRHGHRSLEAATLALGAPDAGRVGADVAITDRESLEVFVRGKRLGGSLYGGSRSPLAKARTLAGRARDLAETRAGTPDGAVLVSLKVKLDAFVVRATSVARGAVVGEREPGLSDTDDRSLTKAGRSFREMSNAEVEALFTELSAQLGALSTVGGRLSAAAQRELDFEPQLDLLVRGLEKARAELDDIDDLPSKLAKEAELKLMVPSEAVLERIEAGLGMPTATLFQENLYFDLDGRLSAAYWSLRLRVENGEAVLTLKGPRSSQPGDALVVRPESPEIPITAEDVARIKAGRQNPLELLATGLADKPERAYVDEARALLGGAPELTAGITNERRVYPVVVSGRELHLEVDRSNYGPHGNFYELELEVPAHLSAKRKREVEAWITNLLVEQGVTPERGPGKHSRLNSLLSRK